MLKHFQMLEKILFHPACEIIPQITFDFHLIEISGGYCFHIPSRKFIPCPIPDSKRGLVSPRAFIPYECSTTPDPGFFQDGILNSFPETNVRVNFLNKLYQCLFASQMPQKVRKLVVAGPKDSGKTCWASIFHRIIPPGYIASITNEQQFSAAMITNETQLVFVDEWSESTLQSDLAKTILQGGWMVSAVKHGPAKCIMNNSPYYITTNNVPDFGREDENVKRRIAVFTTKSLPQTLPGVDRWIFDHAMDCVAWMASEITSNHAMIDDDELWYEVDNLAANIIDSNHGAKLFETSRMKLITNADLRQVTCSTVQRESIDESFEAECSHRRLSRKRRARVVVYSSGDDSEDDEPAQLQASDTVAEPTMDEHDPNMPSCSTSLSVPFAIDGCPEGECTERNEDRAGDSGLAVKKTTDVAASESNDEERERADETQYTPYISTPSSLVLNSSLYFDKVADLLKSKFLLEDVTHIHARSFMERRRKAERRREREERRFWSDADPTIDAWMLVIGEQRHVFDVDAYVVRHPDAHKYVERVRNMVNVRVLQCSCPVFQAAKRSVSAESETENDNVDSQDQPRRPELSSQTYWTKVKSWRPW